MNAKSVLSPRFRGAFETVEMARAIATAVPFEIHSRPIFPRISSANRNLFATRRFEEEMREATGRPGFYRPR
jgi:hypothetical protein